MLDPNLEKHANVNIEVDGVSIEGYGRYYSRDFCGAVMTSPFNGVRAGKGWHHPAFNPFPMEMEPIYEATKEYLEKAYKECCLILNERLEDMEFMLKWCESEKSLISERLEAMRADKRLLKSKLKSGQLTQKEYQQLVKTFNTEKIYAQQSYEDYFENEYNKRYGESIINNLEETVQILIEYMKKKNNEAN